MNNLTNHLYNKFVKIREFTIVIFFVIFRQKWRNSAYTNWDHNRLKISPFSSTRWFRRIHPILFIINRIHWLSLRSTVWQLTFSCVLNMSRVFEKGVSPVYLIWNQFSCACWMWYSKYRMKKKEKSLHFSRKGCLVLVKSSVWNIKTVLSHVTQNTVLHKSATVRITLYSTYCHSFKFIWETIFDVVHYSMRFPARILNLKTLRHPWDLRRP